MIAFIEKLNSEVLRSIERIESRDTDVLKKSLEASVSWEKRSTV